MGDVLENLDKDFLPHLPQDGAHLASLVSPKEPSNTVEKHHLKSQHFTGQSKNPSSLSCPAFLELCTKRLSLQGLRQKWSCYLRTNILSEKQDSLKRKLSVLNKHNYAVSTHKIHTNWILRCWEKILMDLSLCISPSSYTLLNITNLFWQWRNCCLGRPAGCLTETIPRRLWKLWTL